MKWINIKERMPPKDEPVICYYSDMYMDVLEYWYDDEQTRKPIFMRPPMAPVDNVTHWMPLPEPPE